MVVANRALVEHEMKQHGWDATQLAAAMGKHFNTARNILAGKPVAHGSQVALYEAFERRVPFKKLFVVTPGKSVSAPAGEPPPARQSGAVGASVPHEREEEVA